MWHACLQPVQAWKLENTKRAVQPRMEMRATIRIAIVALIVACRAHAELTPTLVGRKRCPHATRVHGAAKAARSRDASVLDTPPRWGVPLLATPPRCGKMAPEAETDEVAVGDTAREAAAVPRQPSILADARDIARGRLCRENEELRAAVHELRQDREKLCANVQRQHEALETVARHLHEVSSQHRQQQLVLGCCALAYWVGCMQVAVDNRVSNGSVETDFNQSSKVKTLQSEIGELKAQVQEMDELRKTNEHMLAQRSELMAERRRLQGVIQELTGNIRVLCRIKPLTSSPSGALCAGGTLRVTGPVKPYGMGVEISTAMSGGRASVAELQGKAETPQRGGERSLQFVFDSVLDQSASQAEVFEEVASSVESVLDGYRVCIFAYGQTGSGKTYTLQGPPGNLCLNPSQKEPRVQSSAGSEVERGIIQRSVEMLFERCRVKETKGWQHTIQVSYLEIYNENFRDLLDHRLASPKQMEVALDAQTGLQEVTGLICMDVLDASAVFRLLDYADKIRVTAATNSNQHSSRSHAVFTLKVQGWNPDTQQQCTGALKLVDLAGAERLSTHQADRDSRRHEEEKAHAREKETRNINKSLSCLGDVIQAISNKDRFVPFRNSKLTHLLQPYLSGGNSKTMMVVNLNPAQDHLHETLRAARFAARVSSCEIGVARKSSRFKNNDRL